MRVRYHRLIVPPTNRALRRPCSFFEQLEERRLLAVGAGPDDYGAAELAAGSIQGNVWNDANGNGQRDEGELGISGCTVLLDTNGNRRVDSGEVTAVTDPDGNYLIANVPEGSYAVTLVSQPAWRQTTPEISETIGRLFYSSGFIRELNPLTGAVLNEFSTPLIRNLVGNEALAVGPDSLFYFESNSEYPYPSETTGSPATLWELDPDTGAVIDYDPLVDYPFSGMGGAAYLDGHVYLLGANKLVEWDPVADAVVREVPFSNLFSGSPAPTGLAAAPDLGVVFAASFYDSRIYRLDPNTGALLGSFPSQVPFGGSGAAQGLAYYNGELYVHGQFIINRLDPSTGELLGTFPITVGPIIGGLGGDGAGNPGAHEVTVGAGAEVEGVDFGAYEVVLPNRSRTPPAPLLLNDSGVSGTDRLTRNNNSGAASPLNFRFSGLPRGATITLLHNWEPVASVVVTSVSTTQVSFPSGQTLADGLHYFSARLSEPGKELSYDAPAIPVMIDTAAPTVSLVGPAPPVNATGINTIELHFNERIAQLEIADLVLTRDGGPNLLTSEQTLTGDSLARLGNLASITSTPGYYVLSFAAGQNVIDRAGNSLGTTPILEFVTGVLGDINADGVLDNFDIQPFERALTNPEALLAEQPQAIGYHLRGDIDGDGDFDNFDIQPFEQLLTSGGAAAASESPEGSVTATVERDVLATLFAEPSRSVSFAPPAGNADLVSTVARDMIFRAIAASDDSDSDSFLSIWSRRFGRRTKGLVLAQSW